MDQDEYNIINMLLTFKWVYDRPPVTLKHIYCLWFGVCYILNAMAQYCYNEVHQQ